MNQRIRKTIRRICMTAFAAAVLCIMLPKLGAGAQAADAGKCGSYYAYVSQGNLCVRRTTTSTAKKIVTPGTYYSVDSCVMDDTYIYYAAVNKSGTKTRFYRIKPSGTGKTLLIELTGKNTELQGICGNSLVYTYTSSTSTKVHTRRYKIGGSRTYKVRNNLDAEQQSGDYVVGLSATDTLKPTSLYSVKAETGDWYRLSRSCVAYQVIDDTVYYIETTETGAQNGTVSYVKSCSLTGGSVKILAQDLTDVDLEQAIPTAKALYYMTADGSSVCRYSYSTAKSKTLLSGEADATISLSYLGSRVVVQDLDDTDSSFTNTVYTITPPKSTIVKQTTLTNRTIFYVSGKTYYARKSSSGTVSLGRFS